MYVDLTPEMSSTVGGHVISISQEGISVGKAEYHNQNTQCAT